MHILVTGAAGYVGSTVVQYLLDQGERVTGVDRLDFGGESLLPFWQKDNFQFKKADLTEGEAVSGLFEGNQFDAIVHLAAIVGDPACAQAPDEARRVNWEASVALLDQAIRHGVHRFVFASTCSNYGKMEEAGGFVHENSPLNPVSLYAELKVEFEKHLQERAESEPSFCGTALRFATVYGVSPRMRFDLTVNEFVKDVSIGKRLGIYGEQFWRPYCHVRDFANAFHTVLTADKSKVDGEVFNIGDTSENYTKLMLWERISEIVPSAEADFVHKDEDPRDYRVNCDKVKQVLGFQITRRVPDGIREIHEVVSSGVIQDPENQRYYNIPYSG